MEYGHGGVGGEGGGDGMKGELGWEQLRQR